MGPIGTKALDNAVDVVVAGNGARQQCLKSEMILAVHDAETTGVAG